MSSRFRANPTVDTQFNVHTINSMKITYDPEKDARNVALRGLSFELARAFDFETAWVIEDDRYDYGEMRYRGVGLLNGRLHVLVFTETETGIRVISLRKANTREVRLYEQATQP